MKAFGLDARLGAAVAAEIRLNDMLVSEKGAGMMGAQSLAIQHEVVPGANEIVVFATGAGLPPGAPPQRLDGVDPAGFFVELDLDLETVRDLGDAYEVVAEPVRDLRWRPGEGAGEMVLPQRISLPFTAPSDVAPPVWTRAAPVQPEATRPAIAAALADLRRLLESGDLAGFQGHMRLRNEDMARAYPHAGTARERAARDTASLERALSGGQARFAPIDAAQLLIRPYAGGRVLDVRAPDGAPPLRAAVPGADPLFFAASFAVVDGRLSVVR